MLACTRAVQPRHRVPLDDLGLILRLIEHTADVGVRLAQLSDFFLQPVSELRQFAQLATPAVKKARRGQANSLVGHHPARATRRGAPRTCFCVAAKSSLAMASMSLAFLRAARLAAP